MVSLFHIIKAITWRIIGSIDTFILSWFISENLDYGLTISGLEIISKIILYYMHEITWFKLPFKDSKKRHFLKTLTWRVIGTADTFFLSSFITGNPLMGLKIGTMETFSKMILYYLHEKLWYKSNYGIKN